MTKTDSSISIKGPAVQQMFGSIAHRYDLGNTILSGGTHKAWKRRLIAEVPSSEALRENGTAIDLCTGTGDLVLPLSKKVRHVIGIDFCEEMIAHGKARGAFDGHPPLVADALNLPIESDTIDVVTVAFGVRNFEDRAKGLTECSRVLQPGGHLLILEFGQPSFPLFREAYNFYSRYFMPLIGGLVTGNRAAYEYLPKTAKEFPCGEDFLSLTENLPLQKVKITPIWSGLAYIYHFRNGE